MAQIKKNLSISVRPESGPEILGLRPSYTAEEKIDVVCRSEKSYPASQLDFFINDEPVRTDVLITGSALELVLTKLYITQY